MFFRRGVQSLDIVNLQNHKPIAFKTRSNGKLLLTGEYFVLEGAVALSIPLKWGQSMKVTESSGSDLRWKTLDQNGEKWFECTLNLIDFSIEKTTDDKKAVFIQQLIKSASQLNSDFLSKWKKYKVECKLEFNPEWGLGSSSTLIANLATWAELSPFELFFDTQNGSGFDVASAIADSPILYSKGEEELTFEEVDLNKELLEKSYVFYQGKKANSRAEVQKWKKSARKIKAKDIKEISSISEQLAECSSIKSYIELIDQHEKLVQSFLEIDSITQKYADFNGGMKSLGAWGGDFGLAVHEDPEYTKAFLEKHNFDAVFSLKDIVL